MKAAQDSQRIERVELRDTGREHPSSDRNCAAVHAEASKYNLDSNSIQWVLLFHV
jgi:hypothetical protein